MPNPYTMVIFVAPHERHEVVNVYADKLTKEQQERILNSDHGWKISFKPNGLTVIEPLEL